MNEIFRKKVVHALNNEVRVNILELLESKDMSVSEITDKLVTKQSNISQQLACLKDCGLITSKKDGKYVIYSLTSKKIFHLLEVIDQVGNDIGWNESTEEECISNVD
ncbi:transcriptional regulator [Companilactobacillus sp. RD055328]|uniref:ArsR/SmtB family transcription factor n=1 Tax=Companilactobacillus sp. RD055328 TaxID=2916634 RepID=UPI001FC82E09|nr:metalloregulator ArsR/SmtB family transcription factor [Companilactobacillus sp. RD055328]GKQ43349.1 transcriptional regulator [Companilactobacillus sp. RD055328]